MGWTALQILLILFLGYVDMHSRSLNLLSISQVYYQHVHNIHSGFGASWGLRFTNRCSFKSLLRPKCCCCVSSCWQKGARTVDVSCGIETHISRGRGIPFLSILFRFLLDFKVLTAYIDAALSRDIRQKQLRETYHLACQCRLCTPPPNGLVDLRHAMFCSKKCGGVCPSPTEG